jgi:hypothetical protein
VLKSWFLNRPHTIFNPENRQHREAYHEFTKTGHWQHCPYQFVVEEPYTDIVTQIERQLGRYYTEQEFNQQMSLLDPFLQTR